MADMLSPNNHVSFFKFNSYHPKCAPHLRRNFNCDLKAPLIWVARVVDIHFGHVLTGSNITCVLNTLNVLFLLGHYACKRNDWYLVVIYLSIFATLHFHQHHFGCAILFVFNYLAICGSNVIISYARGRTA